MCQRQKSPNRNVKIKLGEVSCASGKSSQHLRKKKIIGSQAQPQCQTVKPRTKCDFRTMPRLHNNSGALNLPHPGSKGKEMNGLFNPFIVPF